MNEKMSDRALLLLDRVKLESLAKPNSKEYVRWQNVKRKNAQIRADEVEALGEAFPKYRWWLMTGEVMPEVGQTSPAYEEANGKLHKQNAG